MQRPDKCLVVDRRSSAHDHTRQLSSEAHISSPSLMAPPLHDVSAANVEKAGASTIELATDPLRPHHVNDVQGLRLKKGFDEAYAFLREHGDEDLSQLDLRQIRRKIDLHIVPVFYLNYLAQFLDKFLFGYAIVMGIEKDIGLQGNETNNCASALWWAYLICSAFIGLVVNKVPAAKLLGVCMTCWGIVVSCTAAVKSYGGLLSIRFLMGVFDAFIVPCLMLLTSQYYRKDEAALRFELWYTGLGSGVIVGGLLSFGFQHVHDSSLEGWRIMFLALGLLSVVLGIGTFFRLPDTPMKASWLTTAEKVAILQYVSINETGISGSKIEWAQVAAAIRDPQIIILFVGTVVVGTGHGILAVYGVSLIKSFGYSSAEAALLNMPGGAVALVLTIAAAFALGYNICPRWTVAVIGYSVSFLGACLMAFVPKSNKAGNLIGLYLVSFSVPTIGLKYHWITANVSGHTKRSFATASLSAATAIGNIIGPYAVQKKDAPHYRPARITLMATMCGAVVLVAALAGYYVLENKRRDRKFGKPPVEDDDTLSERSVKSETWVNLTDKERKTFRYVL